MIYPLVMTFTVCHGGAMALIEIDDFPSELLTKPPLMGQGFSSSQTVNVITRWYPQVMAISRGFWLSFNRSIALYGAVPIIFGYLLQGGGLVRLVREICRSP